MKLIVLSSYPEKDMVHSAKTVGGAYHTKGILTALKKIHPEVQITVLGEIFGKKETYTENGIQVLRRWKRSTMFSLWKVFSILASPQYDKVLVSFELNMYGNALMSLTVCWQLLLLKIMGKKPNLIVQHVLAGFVSLEKNPFKRLVMDNIRVWFYQLLLLGAHKVIVFEGQFKETVKNYHRDISVIPLFVPEAHRRDRGSASKKIGIPQDTLHVLYFGFLSPYKGVDWLVDSWPQIPNTTLVLAGGINPNHKNNPTYTTFAKNVLEKAQQKGITTTGFIHEKDIPDYFNAADVVILPYTTFFSSSGPLSLAYAYKKGILFSKELKKYAKSADFKKSLEETNLSLESLSFDFTQSGLKKTILWSQKNLGKLTKFSRSMKQKRDPKRVAEMLYQSITN